MKGQTVKSKTGKCQIKVVASWQHTQEVSPAFKRLMMCLLQPRDNQLVEISRADEEHQNEQ